MRYVWVMVLALFALWNQPAEAGLFFDAPPQHPQLFQMPAESNAEFDFNTWGSHCSVRKVDEVTEATVVSPQSVELDEVVDTLITTLFDFVGPSAGKSPARSSSQSSRVVHGSQLDCPIHGASDGELCDMLSVGSCLIQRFLQLPLIDPFGPLRPPRVPVSA